MAAAASTSDSDLARAVHELHGRVQLTIETGFMSDGRVWWRATMSGENFLDGPWLRSDSGVARNHRQALRAASKAFTTRRRRR